MMTKVENPEDYDDPSTFQFGDLIENGWAGDGNPIKAGYFVERGFRKGRLNPGPWIRLTDKRGKFWETSAQSGQHRLKRLNTRTPDPRVIKLVEAADDLRKIIRKAGVENLMNGVQLGQMSWMIKCNDALVYLDTALSAFNGDTNEQG